MNISFVLKKYIHYEKMSIFSGKNQISSSIAMHDRSSHHELVNCVGAYLGVTMEMNPVKPLVKLLHLVHTKSIYNELL